MSQHDDPSSYDYSDPRRYTAQRAKGRHAAGGGAVISRKSGLSGALSRKQHERERQRAQAARGRVEERPLPPESPYDPSGDYRDSYQYQDGSYGAAGARSASRQAPRRFQPERQAAEARPRRRHHIGAKGVIVTILAALVAIYLLVFLPIDQSIAFSDSEAAGLSDELSLHIPLTPYYVLALGSDAREGDTTSRTDTMILFRIDPITAKVTMVSIPRDTKVQIEGHGTQKINAAYAFGGAAGATKAVSDLLGVDINHVAVVHFDGIEALVDALGGVTVDVPVDINDPGYTGLQMPAGTYEMDGHTAMLFSRVRHGFANGDFQRQADQRILIQAIMSKALKSPLSLPAVGRAMGDLLSTTLRCYHLIPLVLRFAITPPAIYSASLPATTATEGGVSYVIVDQQATAQMMQVVKAGGDPSTVSSAS